MHPRAAAFTWPEQKTACIAGILHATQYFVTQDLPHEPSQPEIPTPPVGEDALRQALAERNATLRALLRQREVFAHGVSHDLRAPLRAIQNFSGLLERNAADALDEVGQGYLQRIQDAAERMGVLLESLLDYSRIDNGALERNVVDVTLLAELVLAELQEREPGRVFRATVAPGLLAFGDERQLRMLLTQLLRNAWSFSGGEVVVDVAGKRDGRLIQVAVSDQGIGFDMRYAQKLFEPFQRLHGEDQGAGTGIGLAIAQRIVERHGGRLWAESSPGVGSTFTFELPAEAGHHP